MTVGADGAARPHDGASGNTHATASRVRRRGRAGVGSAAEEDTADGSDSSVGDDDSAAFAAAVARVASALLDDGAFRSAVTEHHSAVRGAHASSVRAHVHAANGARSAVSADDSPESGEQRAVSADFRHGVLRVARWAEDELAACAQDHSAYVHERLERMGAVRAVVLLWMRCEMESRGLRRARDAAWTASVSAVTRSVAQAAARWQARYDAALASARSAIAREHLRSVRVAMMPALQGALRARALDALRRGPSGLSAAAEAKATATTAADESNAVSRLLSEVSAWMQQAAAAEVADVADDRSRGAAGAAEQQVADVAHSLQRGRELCSAILSHLVADAAQALDDAPSSPARAAAAGESGAAPGHYGVRALQRASMSALDRIASADARVATQREYLTALQLQSEKNAAGLGSDDASAELKAACERMRAAAEHAERDWAESRAAPSASTSAPRSAESRYRDAADAVAQGARAAAALGRSSLGLSLPQLAPRGSQDLVASLVVFSARLSALQLHALDDYTARLRAWAMAGYEDESRQLEERESSDALEASTVFESAYGRLRALERDAQEQVQAAVAQFPPARPADVEEVVQRVAACALDGDLAARAQELARQWEMQAA